MRQLIICTKDFIDNYDRIISHGNILLNEDLTYYALIEKDDIAFDPEVHKHAVLVKKYAFSCNYREMGIIKLVNTKIKNRNDLSYYVIGSEFSGVVMAVGTNVTTLKIGDRVLCDGSYPFAKDEGAQPGLPTNHASSELEVIHEAKLAVMPANMDFATGAAFTIGAQTVYSMIEKLAVKQHDSILITGIKSNTSLFAINALKNLQVEIFGLSRSPVDENYFRNMGVKQIFYNSDETPESLITDKEILQHMIQNGKFDCVIDPFGDHYLLKVLDLIAINGKYITCGMSNQTVPKTTPVDLSNQIGKIVLGNISIIGNCLGSTQKLNDALMSYAQNELDVVIDSVIKSDAQAFMNKSFLSKEKLGKVIFSYEP